MLQSLAQSGCFRVWHSQVVSDFGTVRFFQNLQQSGYLRFWHSLVVSSFGTVKLFQILAQSFHLGTVRLFQILAVRLFKDFGTVRFGDKCSTHTDWSASSCFPRVEGVGVEGVAGGGVAGGGVAGGGVDQPLLLSSSLYLPISMISSASVQVLPPPPPPPHLPHTEPCSWCPMYMTYNMTSNICSASTCFLCPPPPPPNSF